MKTLNQNEIDDAIKKVMDYVNTIRNNGGLNIFNELFQTDYRILIYLAEHKDAHPSILADVLHVTRPNVAANLRLLEQKKYIVRNVDENNRRQVFVNMTEEGKKYLEMCDAQLKYLFTGWFMILGKEEVTHLLKILELSSSKDLMTEELKKYFVGE